VPPFLRSKTRPNNKATRGTQQADFLLFDGLLFGSLDAEDGGSALIQNVAEFILRINN
jgi:hypothetical protein